MLQKYPGTPDHGGKKQKKMIITVDKTHFPFRELAVLMGMIAPAVAVWALIAKRRRRVEKDQTGYGEWWDGLGV